MSSGSESCLSAHPSITSSREPGLAGALFRLAKPGIVIAEVMAGLAGMLLASAGSKVTTVVCPTLLAIALAAGGAAMLNGILDNAADRRMLRLVRRCRALEVVGTGRVLVIALFLMGGAFLLTALFLNSLTLLLLAAACSTYLILYTCWLKRRSPWGVLAGAVPGALPPLIGAAAVSGGIAALPLLLAAVIFVWQLPHFWFLALYYRDQYQQAGIPVLPLARGIKLTKRLTLLSAAALFPATLAFSLTGHFSSGFTLVTLMTGILFPLCCYCYLYRTEEYRKGFILSLAYLTVIFMAICTDTILTMNH